MFRIEDDTIEITRGDKGTIELSVEDYTFKSGDVVVFAIYNKKELDKSAVYTKTIEVNEETETILIELTSQDTKLGEMLNKPVDYWYEIELNDDTTILGYDENGAKIFRLYPEGADENDNV